MQKGKRFQHAAQPALMLLLLIAATSFQVCLGGDDPSSPSKTESPKQQILNVACFEECAALDPFHVSSDLERELLPLLFTRLLEREGDKRRFVKGTLLQSYRPLTGFHQSQSGVACLEYEFQLRRNISFSDGTPVTAQDVAKAIELLRVPNGTSRVCELSRFLLAVKVKDAFRFNIQIRQHPLPESLFTFFVASARHLDRRLQGGQHAARRPVGTGPYRIIELLPNGSVRLEPNPHFPGATRRGLPIGEIVLRRYRRADSNRAIEDLQSGTLQLLVGLSSPHISHLKRVVEAYRIDRFHSRGVWVLAFNHRHKLFKNRHARRALLLAIDRNEIFRQSPRAASSSQPAESIVTGPFPPDSSAYDHGLPPHRQNIVVAKSLIQKFGPRVKRPFTLMIPEDDPRIARAAGQFEKQWAHLGFQVFTKSMSFVELRDQVTQSHSFDVACYRIEHNNLQFDLSRLFEPSESAMRPKGTNFMGYAPQPLVQLFLDLRREQDGDRVWEIQNRIHRYLYDELALLPLWYLDNYVVWSRRVVRPSVENTPPGPASGRTPLFHRIEDWRIDPHN